MKFWRKPSSADESGNRGGATPVPASEFLGWAAAREIILDDRYSKVQQMLVFKPYRTLERFWERPANPNELAHFLKNLVEVLPGWDECYLWCRKGCWAPTTNSESDLVMATVYRGAGIPEQWPGALRFRRNDLASVLSVLFVHCAFGWSTCEDVFLVPDHARMILGVDHHDVVWIHFAEPSEIPPVVQRMTEAGFSLPSDVPDPTFKAPAMDDRLQCQIGS